MSLFFPDELPSEDFPTIYCQDCNYYSYYSPFTLQYSCSFPGFQFNPDYREDLSKGKNLLLQPHLCHRCSCPEYTKYIVRQTPIQPKHECYLKDVSCYEFNHKNNCSKFTKTSKETNK